METFGNNTPNRQAAITGLAVVGFIALIGAGMWLAVYSTRFVPSVVGRIGSAAVYLSSAFTPNTSSLSVVPAASTTIPFTEASSTPAPSASTTPKAVEVITLPDTSSASKQTTPTAAGKQSVTITPLPAGLPDLVVKINAVGYVATNPGASFVTSTTVPAGSRPTVTFTVKNVGTKATGAWNFSASIPTQTSYVYQSPDQQTLAPGDSIDYTLGFDQATTGTNQVISITANPSHTVTESSFTNNTASTTITVLGN